MKRQDAYIIVRGGGDIATGTIHRLWRAGFRVLVLETGQPAAIRRQVSLCEAVYEGCASVEGAEAVLVHSVQDCDAVWEQGKIPLLVDPAGNCIREAQPEVVIDAILAKRNLGTNRKMASLTIGLGPGFTAGDDVDVVIETMRGHNLGRIIREGKALPNTGIPGVVGGYAAERVIHAERDGVIRNIHSIGDTVKQGDVIARIITDKAGKTPASVEKDIEVCASIPGMIRGLIRDGYPVTKGFKIADIDPRMGEEKNCFTISDKARCIAGSVLELVCAHFQGERG